MTYRSGWSKYGNKRVRQGVRSFMSKAEARTASELELEVKAGKYTDIDYQFRVKLYVYLPDGSKAYLFDYLVDFRLTKPDGTYLLWETKGAISDTYRTKRKILDLVWLPDHPDYEFYEERV